MAQSKSASANLGKVQGQRKRAAIKTLMQSARDAAAEDKRKALELDIELQRKRNAN